MTKFADMNAAYREVFTKDFPARATVGTGLMGADGDGRDHVHGGEVADDARLELASIEPLQPRSTDGARGFSRASLGLEREASAERVDRSAKASAERWRATCSAAVHASPPALVPRRYVGRARILLASAHGPALTDFNVDVSSTDGDRDVCRLRREVIAYCFMPDHLHAFLRE